MTATIPAYIRLHLRAAPSTKRRISWDIEGGAMEDLALGSGESPGLIAFEGLEGERIVVRPEEVASVVIGPDVPEETLNRLMIGLGGGDRTG